MADNNFYLELKQDSDLDLPLQWFLGDEVTPDPFTAPVRVECEIKSDITSATPLLRLDSLVAGDITVTAATGSIILHFKVADMLTLDFDSGYMDIVVTESYGTTPAVTRDLRGTVHLIKKVTTRG